ncbi:MAG: hypothetical protein NTW74_11245 [Acidobacteria bacterium]|nr:hypothetical protein [Acidobacteriota bacterium]
MKTTHGWKLPPLILHPFAEAAGPDKLVESSRASLMLQGLLPSGETTREELDRRLLDGRFCEIRMLFYVGKDLLRWIEQCMDLVERDEDLKRAGFCYQSFAAILTEDPPRKIREKLKNWGVADYKSIFSRALGLNAVFNELPQRHQETDEINFLPAGSCCGALGRLNLRSLISICTPLVNTRGCWNANGERT